MNKTFGYSMLGSWVFLEMVDEAKKNYKLIKLDPPDFINITCLEKIINLLVRESDLQLLKTVLQLFGIYNTIAILIYKNNKISLSPLETLYVGKITQRDRISH